MIISLKSSSCGKLATVRGWIHEGEVIQMLNLCLVGLSRLASMRGYTKLLDLEHGGLGPLERGSDLSNAHRAHLVSGLNGLLDGLPSNERSEESTRERVTRAVGVDDLLVRQLRYLEHLGGVRFSRGDDDGGVGALGEDDDTGAGGVGFGEDGDRAGDGGDVFGVGEAVGGGVGLGFGLVTEDEVGEGDDALKLSLEELGDEGGREVEGEDLASGRCLLAELLHGLDTVGEEESTNVEQLSTVDDLGDLRGRQMRLLEHLSSTQSGDKGSVMASDDRSAGTGLLALLDLVDLIDTFAAVSGLELLGEIIVTNAAGVHDGASWEVVGSSPGSVLGSTTSNVDDLVRLGDLLVDRDVLLLSEDRVVRLQVVLLEDRLAIVDLDIEERVSDEEGLVAHDG